MTSQIVPTDELSDTGEARFAPIIRRDWAEPAYRAKLCSDPAETLREAGLDIPPDVNVRILEDTPDLLHITVPSGLTVRVVEHTPKVLHVRLPCPPDGEVSDDVLDGLAAGIIPIPPMFVFTMDLPWLRLRKP